MYATANAFGGPSRPASLVAHPTRGMQHRYRNDSTRFRKACIFTTHKALRENTCPIASGDYSTPVSQRMLANCRAMALPIAPVAPVTRKTLVCVFCLLEDCAVIPISSMFYSDIGRYSYILVNNITSNLYRYPLLHKIIITFKLSRRWFQPGQQCRELFCLPELTSQCCAG